MTQEQLENSYPVMEDLITLGSSTDDESDDEHLAINASSLDMLLELSYTESFHTNHAADAIDQFGIPSADNLNFSSSFEMLSTKRQPLEAETENTRTNNKVRFAANVDVGIDVVDVDVDDDKLYDEIKHTSKIMNADASTQQRIKAAFDDNGEFDNYREEMDTINGFLESHHETRIGTNADGQETIATDVSMETEDYVAYMETNAACPNAIRSSFLYCLRKNDLNLTDRILRDVGIEYVLRHCLLYDGIFTANSESEKTEATIKKSCANMFWLTAFYGSADVLEMIIEECWAYFVEEAAAIEPLEEELKRKADDYICLLLNKDVAEYGCTPLFIAAAQNHAAVIKVFLKYRVDPNESNSKGVTAAIVAASRDNIEALEALSTAEHINFHQETDTGISALLAACRYGSISAVRFFTCFAKDADSDKEKGEEKGGEPIINCRALDSRGFSGTALAARYNHTEVVQYLCQINNPDNDRGIDINQRTRDDKDTPLHIAVRHDCKEVIRTFLQMIPREINPFLRNKSGMTPLHVAVREGNVDAVKAIVTTLKDEMPGLDTVDNNGMTPLFYASWKGDKEIVTLLAPHSDTDRLCNIPIIKHRQNSAINHGELSTDNADNTDAYNAVKAKTVTVQMSALIASVKKNHIDIIYTLLYCNANPNQTDHKGYTPLCHAAKYGHLEIVEILVTHGADLKLRSKGGRLPIHKARKNKHFEVVEYLEKAS